MTKRFFRFLSDLWLDQRGEVGDPGDANHPAPAGNDPPATDPPPQRAASGDDDIRTTLQQQQQALQALWQQQQQQRQPQQPQANPDAIRERMNEAFWQNPLGATEVIAQRQAAAAFQAAQAANYPRNVEDARTKARATDPEIFDRYRAEIEAKMAEYDPTAHQDTRVWEIALKTVKSEHFEELAAEREKRKVTMRGGPQSPTAPSPITPKGPEAELDHEEKIVARDIFKISDKEFKKGRENYEKQRRGASPDVLENPWSAHVKHRALRKHGAKTEYGEGPMLTLDSELQGRRTRRERENG